jgi:hypothetical protein
MEFIQLIICILMTRCAVFAETNQLSTADTVLQRFEAANKERLAKGERPLPIPLSPEEDARLVSEGVLPPPGEETPGYGQSFQFSYRDTPLREVLNFYSQVATTTVTIAQGVNETFTFTSPGNLSRDDTISEIKRQLAKKRIVLVKQANGTERAEWISE